MKRLLLFGDLHCGHELGLTHPHWWQDNRRKYQEPFWKGYLKKLKKIGKVDLAVGMGDLVDGPGDKDNTHHLETDLNEQVDMAIAAVKEIQADKMFLIRGTGYHVDNGLSIEDLIARELRVPIYDQKSIKIGERRFNFKHAVGRSTTPYGGCTPLAKEVIKNELKALMRGHADDYFFRGHTHMSIGAVLARLVGEESILKQAMTVPALQLCGPTECKFTRKLGDDQYDVGLLEVICYNDGGIRVIPHLIDNGGI